MDRGDLDLAPLQQRSLEISQRIRLAVGRIQLSIRSETGGPRGEKNVSFSRADPSRSTVACPKKEGLRAGEA
jgi:hypothetical protein